jgi:hypothetical protein
MSAVISSCGKYRYRLYRECGDLGGCGQLLWIMLNPSTADASQDDPTIRKCIGFTKRLGFARLAVGNLFAYRATDPKDLFAAVERLKENEDAWLETICTNTSHIASMLDESSAVMLAWGSHGGRFLMRVSGVRAVLEEYPAVKQLQLGLCKNGQPLHPLMVSYDVLQAMEGRP